MPGLALSQFFFPGPSSKSRRSKTKRSSRSRPASINISRNSGANIYPCIWVSNTDPATSRPYPGYHEEWKNEPIARPPRCQRPMSLSQPPPNPWSAWWSGRTDYDAAPQPPTHFPYPPPPPPCAPAASRRSGHRPARPNRQAAHHAPHDGTGDPFLQFPIHWGDVVQSRTCFVHQPHNASAGGQAGFRRHSAPPDDIGDRALHFCVVRRARRGRFAEEAAVNEYIITCSAGSVAEVLSSLAPEGSGQRVGVACRTPWREEHGGLDLLERVLPHGWPFRVIIEEE